MTSGPAGFWLQHPTTTAVLFMVVGALPLFLAGAYAVRFQEEFGFGSAEFGYAVASFFVLGAIGANRLGPWVDRLGASVGIRIATSLAVISTLLIAFVASSWQWIAVALAIAGLGNALVQLSTNRLIASGTTSSKHGVGFAAKQAGVPIASLAAGFLVSILGPTPYQATFVGFAIVALVLVAIAPRRPRDRTPPGKPTRDIGASFKQLLALAVAGSLAGATGNSLAVFAVDAFESVGFSEGSAATVLAIGSAAAVAARLLVGKLIDWRESDGYQELTILMIAGSIGFLVAASSAGNATLLIVGVIGAFASAWGWPAVIYYTAVRTSDAAPATASGVVLTGVFAGMMVGPLIIGLIADAVGFRWSWAVSS
ncbi:MAG: MFS transporter, partial [Acidimicrobiia bacterium]